MLHAAFYLSRRHSKPDKILRWFRARDGEVPEGAVEAGRVGGREGEVMYIGRVVFPTYDVVPGNVIPSRNACFVAWKGIEVESTEYEVLVNTAPEFCRMHWTPTKENNTGDIPREAVRGGHDETNDEPLYIIRARPPGSFGTHAGHLRFGELAGTISADGVVYEIPEYKTLCRHIINIHERPTTH